LVTNFIRIYSSLALFSLTLFSLTNESVAGIKACSALIAPTALLAAMNEIVATRHTFLAVS